LFVSINNPTDKSSGKGPCGKNQRGIWQTTNPRKMAGWAVVDGKIGTVPVVALGTMPPGLSYNLACATCGQPAG